MTTASPVALARAKYESLSSADLVTAALNLIYEREELAREAGGGVWKVDHDCHLFTDGQTCNQNCDCCTCCRVDGDDITIYNEGGHDPKQAEHIAANDPRTVMLLCRSYRQAVHAYVAAPEGTATAQALRSFVEGLATGLELR